MAHSLVHLLVVLIVVGIILVVVEKIPLDDWLKQIVRIVTIGVIAIYLIVTLFNLLPLAA